MQELSAIGFEIDDGGLPDGEPLVAAEIVDIGPNIDVQVEAVKHHVPNRDRMPGGAIEHHGNCRIVQFLLP
jgi:hypothetical protein